MGGSTEILILQELTTRNNLNDEDSFYIYLAYSEALQKKKRTEEAVRACRMALSYFPGNAYGQNLLADLRS